MTQVTAPAPRPVAPAGWEQNDRQLATVDIVRGQLVKYIAGGCRLLTTAELEADGICLKDCPAGMMCDIGVDGEMDGFSGLTPGATLYPSAVTAGAIATDVVADVRPNMIKAIRPTRIRYKF